MTSARSAATTTTSKMAAPSSTLGLSARRRTQRGTRGAVPSVIADARIDDGVDHVGRRRYQHHALHHRIVPAQDGGDDQAPEPGDVEDDLGDDGAADEHGHG